MPREIPGFYFDPDKQKYFRIEKSATAPASAAWSSDAVRKRKADNLAAQQVKSRERLLRRHIKRSVILTGSACPITTALLRRETGDVGGGGSGSGSGSGSLGIGRVRVGRAGFEEVLGPAAWAGGIVGKGEVSLSTAGHGSVSGTGRRRGGSQMPCFWVGGDEDGLNTGLIYAGINENATGDTVLAGSYITTDAHGAIDADPARLAARSRSRRSGVFHELVPCRRMSSLKYHAPSHRMLVTSREASPTCSISVFTPATVDNDEADWLLGRAHSHQRWVMRTHSRQEWIVHSSAPAPPCSASDTICALGTNNGILRVVPNAITAIGPKSWDPTTMTPLRPQQPRQAAGLPSSASSPSFSSFSSSPFPAQGNPYDNTTLVPARAPREIFDLTFHAGHPQLLLAAGREGRLLHADLRTRAVDWSWFRAGSTVARLRDVGPHGVLVSGPRNTMRLYDLRFTARFRKSGNVDAVIAFPDHRNEAHWEIGMDVCEEVGVVAAAQDDGSVRLFNLRSGALLRNPCLDNLKTGTPVQALMFKTVPGERGPSLFLGEGSYANKYSWGNPSPDDEI